MMKHYINKILLLLACSVFAVSCVHDPVEEISTAGQIVPVAYWEQVKPGVVAGDNVSFELSYYSPLKKNIELLEVWYNIYMETVIEASCPILVKTYTISTKQLDTVRTFLPIQGYTHSEDNWNESKSVYFLKGEFPTTYTLSPFSWGNLDKFDDEAKVAFKKYFPAGFEEAFRDSVYSKMTVDDFRKVLTATNPKIPADKFDSYVVCALDSASGRDVCNIKPDSLQSIRNAFYSIPYDSLFFDSTKSRFALEYKKTYSLGAKFKVTDAEGGRNYSEEKIIELQ